MTQAENRSDFTTRARRCVAAAWYRIALITLASIVVAFLGLPSAASAAITHRFESSVSASEVPNTPDFEGISVGQTSHHLYVGWGNPPPLVDVFDSSLHPPGFLEQITENVPLAKGLVVADESRSRVYVLGQFELISINSATGKLVTGFASGGHLENESIPNHGDVLSAMAVDPTDGDLLVASGGYVNSFNTAGEFQSQFLPFPTEDGQGNQVLGLAVDSSGDLYADTAVVAGGTSEWRVSKFDASGTLLRVVTSGEAFGGIAVDAATGDLYVVNKTFVDQYDSAGSLLGRFGLGHLSSATNGEGNISLDESTGDVYVVDRQARLDVFGPSLVVPDVSVTPASSLTRTTATLNGEVNPDGVASNECSLQYVTEAAFKATEFENLSSGGSVPCEEPDASEIGAGTTPVAVHAAVSGLTEDTTYESRLLVETANGENQSLPVSFRTTGPPEIGTLSFSGTTSIATDLMAQLNPNGFATTYHFEYGPTSTYGTSVPVPAGDLAASRSAVGVSQAVAGLSPDTTYHYRLVAASECEPGHLCEAVSPDATVTTYPSGQTGLPDGRAYELVSTDKEDGEVYSSGLWDELGELAYNYLGPFESSLTGDAVTYLGEPAATGNGSQANQFLAHREPGGWQTRSISPPALPGTTTLCGQVSTLGTPFSLFSPELTAAAVTAVGRPGLGSPSTYCYGMPFLLESSSATYTPLFTSKPPDRPPTAAMETGQGVFGTAFPIPPGNPPRLADLPLEIQAASSDLSRIFFEADDALAVTGTAAFDGGPFENNLYEWSGGHLRLVNVLPDGSTTAGAIIGGPGNRGTNNGFGYPGDTTHAVSADGSRVYWTGSDGDLYLRQNHTISLEVDEAEAGAEGPGGGGRFLDASADGSVAFFIDCHRLTTDSTAVAAHGCAQEKNEAAGVSEYTGNDLYRFDLSAPAGHRLTDLSVDHESSDLLGADVQGLVGASEDGSDVYFVATGVLGALHNAAGESPVSGRPNLYLDRGDQLSFIATLSAEDNEFNGGGGIAKKSRGDWRGDLATASARVASTGTAVVFNSVRKLGPYDNHGLAEVYLFDAESGRLSCVSCSPTGAPPVARRLHSQISVGSTILRSARTNGAQPRWVDDEGNRVFFDTFEPLVAADTNEALDVYEWEAAGTGTCTESGPSYSPPNGGCLSLISTGTGSENSYFDDASPSGRDVFFTTRSRLVRSDQDQQTDLYDARVGGGFPEPEIPCSSPGSCQGPESTPPPSVSPGSSSFSGPGNVPATTPGCKKGFVRRHGKCTKKAPSHPAGRKGKHVKAKGKHRPKGNKHGHHKGAAK